MGKYTFFSFSNLSKCFVILSDNIYDWASSQGRAGGEDSRQDSIEQGVSQ